MLLGLTLNPEDIGNIFIRNAGGVLPDYMALCPRRQYLQFNEEKERVMEESTYFICLLKGLECVLEGKQMT
jgi:hypothetical protein